VLDDTTRDRCLGILRQGLSDIGPADDTFWPAMHAAEALTMAGHGDEVRAAIEPRLATETNDQHMCGLARELVRAGDRGRAALMLDILAGDDPHGHVHACESLYKVHEIGDGRLMLAAMKQTSNTTQALMAAAALARWGNADALALLRTSVGSDDVDTARIAAWVLARVGDASDIPALRAGLARFDDPAVAANFQNALAALGDESELAAITQNLGDDDAAIRTYAAVFAGEARATSCAAALKAMLDDENADARIRAAQSLLVLAGSATRDSGDDISRDVYIATAAHPRYSEGSILPLADGSLLFAITEFSGSGADDARAQIIARSSSDGGRSWGDPRVLQENVGVRNVMSTTLRRLETSDRAAGPIGLFYLVKNSPVDLKVYLRVSRDEAATFGESVLVSDAPGYHVMNNDRITRLTSGRLLAPVASTGDVRSSNHFVSYCFFSDDGGVSWQRGAGEVDYAKRGAMEPEVIELADGRVAMIIRTQLGHIAISHSDDGGDTWSRAASWGVQAPEAPSTLRRIPSTGDLLLIYNDTFVRGAGHGGQRTPLTAAVSSDDGRTWKHRRNLETDTDSTYAYTSLTFDRGRAVMSYYVGENASGKVSTRFRSLPISWFYDAD
jgi:sialidase-1